MIPLPRTCGVKPNRVKLKSHGAPSTRRCRGCVLTCNAKSSSSQRAKHEVASDATYFAGQGQPAQTWPTSSALLASSVRSRSTCAGTRTPAVPTDGLMSSAAFPDYCSLARPACLMGSSTVQRSRRGLDSRRFVGEPGILKGGSKRAMHGVARTEIVRRSSDGELKTGVGRFIAWQTPCP